MRRVIIHMMITFLMCLVMDSIGYGIDTWQYWVILLGICGIFLNASFKEKEDDYLMTCYKQEMKELRDNLLVTMGARAAYMDSRNLIYLPEGVVGEDMLANFVSKTVDEYIWKLNSFTESEVPNFDEYIETALKEKYPVGNWALSPMHADKVTLGPDVGVMKEIDIGEIVKRINEADEYRKTK